MGSLCGNWDLEGGGCYFIHVNTSSRVYGAINMLRALIVRINSSAHLTRTRPLEKSHIKNVSHFQLGYAGLPHQGRLARVAGLNVSYKIGPKKRM